MNCALWQERIALFSGGDLAADDALFVERHLTECAECRAFAESLSETRTMLLSLRSVDEEQVAAVRMGVLHRIQSPRTPAILAWLPYAAAIAALAFGIAFWRARVEPPVRVAHVAPPPVAEFEHPLVAPVEKKAAPPKRVRRVRPTIRPPQVPVNETEPTVVTLYTDDPDVVIVWITE
jgi:anti-sigma factor RsiW